jgi:hypothetical protein
VEFEKEVFSSKREDTEEELENRKIPMPLESPSGKNTLRLNEIKALKSKAPLSTKYDKNTKFLPDLIAKNLINNIFNSKNK